MFSQLGQLLRIKITGQPSREVKGNQPSMLILTSGHVLQHPHQDLAEGAARLTAAALRVLGPVELLISK